MASGCRSPRQGRNGNAGRRLPGRHAAHGPACHARRRRTQANLALGSWLAFESMGQTTMVMGDLVLTEDEIEPVMKKLADGGIEITALHNHLLRASPPTFYMHVLGRG